MRKPEKSVRRRSDPVAVLGVDRDSATPLHRQLYEAYRDAIIEGRIAPGHRLPSTRALAAELGVSRTTVVGGFEQLMAEGYIEGRIGAGTYVASAMPESTPVAAASPGLHARPRRRPGVERLLEPNPGEWLTPHAPFRLSVAALDEFPFETWARLSARHARSPKRSSLQYGDPMGHPRLRAELSAYLRASRGVRCEPEQVMVVSGSQQALDLCARVLVGANKVWVEEPGYVGARNAFRLAGATLVPVPVDAQGLVVAKGVHCAPRAAAAYVTPSHQYPLGVTMTAARRLELLEWARASGAWIVEDDYDSELRYDSLPITALHGLDRHARVVYVGTFSKVLFPSLRIGYLVLPESLVEAYRQVRDAVDVFPPTFQQEVLADFLEEGHFARHLRRMRGVYRQRREVLLAALERRLGDRVQILGAGAGMHVAITFDPRHPDEQLARRCAKDGVNALPLSATFAGRARLNGLVLGYGGFPERRLEEATELLARAFEATR